MPDIIFHIGYPKTASTYLQKQIFSQVYMLGQHSIVSGGGNDGLNKDVPVYMKNDSANIWATDAGRALADRIEQFGQHHPILYSQEHLVRPAVWLPTPYHPATHGKDAFPIAAHLKAFASSAWGSRGTVRVLVTIRNQAEWLASSYAQVSNVCRASQKNFVQFVESILKNNSTKFDSYFFDYYLLYQNLCTALGPEKVTFLAMEDMDTPHYWGVLNNLLGTDFEIQQNTANERANVRRKNPNEWQLRQRDFFLNEKLPKRPVNIRKPLKKCERQITRALTNQHKKTIHMPDDLRREIMSVYEDSNRAIAEAINRDLSAYGYY